MRSACTTSKFVLLEEFLFPDELSGLLSYTLERENEFEPGTVVTSESEHALVPGHRRSRLLFNVGPYLSLFEDRIRACLGFVLERLAHETFPILGVDAEISANNDGDFFGPHRDAHQSTPTREISYVYYFHREPKAFAGGQLLIYEPDSWEHDVIVPAQNSLVFFSAEAVHEVTVVTCPSHAFADSRFALNGWIHRERSPLVND